MLAGTKLWHSAACSAISKAKFCQSKMLTSHCKSLRRPMISLHDCGDHRRWLAHSSSFKDLSLSQSLLRSWSAHLEGGQSVASYLDSLFIHFHLPPQALPTPLWFWTFTIERSAESQAKTGEPKLGGWEQHSHQWDLPDSHKAEGLEVELSSPLIALQDAGTAIHISLLPSPLFCCCEDTMPKATYRNSI